MSKDIKQKNIYCCGCQKDMQVRLTDGSEIYPHRGDLYNLPFWKCDVCKNFVGCHHKTKNRTKELGCIPTPELKKARQFIHALIDPIWQQSKDYNKRGVIYRIMAEKMGKKEYHNGKLRTIEEAREAYKIAKQMPKLLQEREAQWEKIKQEYLLVKPIEGRKYLVFYQDEWKEMIFNRRSKIHCSLHGDLSYEYWFYTGEIKIKKGKEIKCQIMIDIDGEISLEKRTEELKKLIRNL